MLATGAAVTAAFFAATAGATARHHNSDPTPSTAHADFTYEKPNILPLASRSVPVFSPAAHGIKKVYIINR
jgi:hypothetical protein